MNPKSISDWSVTNINVIGKRVKLADIFPDIKQNGAKTFLYPVEKFLVEFFDSNSFHITASNIWEVKSSELQLILSLQPESALFEQE